MSINPLQTVKSPSQRRIAIHVTLAAQRLIRSGHPWVFDKSIVKQSHDGVPGDLAVLYDNKGKFLGVGLYDPFSPIRVRVLQPRKSAPINSEFYQTKIIAAMEIRKPLANNTNGFRIIHGENDGLPGLVVDRYADTLVVKIYSSAWVPHLNNVVVALIGLTPLKRIVLRMSRICLARPELLYGLEDGANIYGPPLTKAVEFKENGILFEADCVKGQKTGFFLDQRENRARVEKLSKNKNVLNVFSYTSGFSLYAARGGAKSVTNVEISKTAIECAKRNLRLNKDEKSIAACKHSYISEDAFKALERLAIEGKRYDMVIVDPPNFAKKKSEAQNALKAYARLVRLAFRVLNKKGTLVMASCSSRVGADDFFKTVFITAQNAGGPLQELERTGHAIDHPIGFPEGAYLKCIFAKA